MVFPGGGPLPRHPSQLYEFFLEGVVLFAVLWSVKDRVRQNRHVVTALFIVLYGLFRFVVEFFREPDPQLGLHRRSLYHGPDAERRHGLPGVGPVVLLSIAPSGAQ